MSVRTRACTGKADRSQHPAHYSFAPLVQRDPDQRLTGHGIHHREVIDSDRPVIQFDSGPEFFAEPTGHRPVHRGDVGLGYLVGRVHQPMREFAVVGQQDQAFGVGVQPSHMEELLVAADPVLHQVTDARSAAVVRHRRMHALRFVQRQIHQGLVEDHPCAVDADLRGIGVDPGAEFGHHLAVDLDAAIGDHPLRDPSRRNPGLRQHFLKANPVRFAGGVHH